MSHTSLVKKKFKLYEYYDNNIISNNSLTNIKSNNNDFYKLLSQNNIDLNDKNNIITYQDISNGKIINLSNKKDNIEINYKDINKNNYKEKELKYVKKNNNSYISSSSYSSIYMSKN